MDLVKEYVSSIFLLVFVRQSSFCYSLSILYVCLLHQFTKHIYLGSKKCHLWEGFLLLDDDQCCILSVSSFYIHTLTQYFLWSCRDHMRLCNCLYDLSYTSVSLMNPSRRQAETVQTEIFLRLCLLIHLNTQRYYRLPWLESKCNSLVSTPVTLPPPFVWTELCALLPLLMPADTPRFVGHKVMTFSPLHDTGK